MLDRDRGIPILSCLPCMHVQETHDPRSKRSFPFTTPADVITSVSPLGSTNGQVLLLVNASLLLRVTLDQEFGRLTVQGHLSIEPSLQLQAFQDEAVPVGVGRLVDCVFQSPLLFTLSHDGFVCILYRCGLPCVCVCVCVCMFVCVLCIYIYMCVCVCIMCLCYMYTFVMLCTHAFAPELSSSHLQH